MKPTHSSSLASSNLPRYADDPLQITSTWQDEADNEEWSAWMDETDSNSAAKTEDDDDEFGAWVDSKDFHTATDFHTPIVTPSISPGQAGNVLVVTVRDLRRLDDLKHDLYTPRQPSEQSSTIVNDDTSSLYLNPWHDDILPNERLSYHFEDDDFEVDPETDSALAFSAWESILSPGKAIQSESDDGSAVFDAWDNALQRDGRDYPPVSNMPYDPANNINDITSPEFSRGEPQPKREMPARSRYGEAGPVEDTGRKPTTWMQRLKAMPSRNNAER